jgi:hypothetical protein
MHSYAIPLRVLIWLWKFNIPPSLEQSSTPQGAAVFAGTERDAQKNQKSKHPDDCQKSIIGKDALILSAASSVGIVHDVDGDQQRKCTSILFCDRAFHGVLIVARHASL